ncbi:Hypothetical protein DHA2_153823 [Giardia duodenalis]|uniref:Uncharacterized protein n=1 Tax=Giardia intestinalis TaxID=5741 RepID=V6T7P6_GIAIN|nr:Hypothetical protein DHA2_153823 [Giardia intestinalis]
MCGVLTEEERALKEKGGSIMAQTRGTCPGCHETRHDRHVPVPPRLGECNAGWRSDQPGDQSRARHKRKAVDVGVIQQPHGYHSEKVRKYRDVLDHLQDGRLPSPQAHEGLKESSGARRGLSGPRCPCSNLAPRDSSCQHLLTTKWTRCGTRVTMAEKACCPRTTVGRTPRGNRGDYHHSQRAAAIEGLPAPRGSSDQR